MGKLFADDVVDQSTGLENMGIDLIDPTDDRDDLATFSQMAQETFQMALGQLKTVQGMRDSLMRKTLLSEAYIASLESAQLALSSMDNMMSVSRIPALEDFKNPYAANASHQIALEGFVEFVKKIWEKIKSFFRDFFKKASLFFKRILRMELDLQSYETYTQQMVAKLRSAKATNVTNRPIPSKLPRLLASPGMDKMDDRYLVTSGLMKIYALQDTIVKIGFTASSPFVKSDTYNNIEREIKAFADKVRSGHATATDAESAEKGIRGQCFVLLDSLFRYKLANERDLPDDAYERMAEEYDRTAISGSDLTVMSVAEVTSSRDSLPAGVNLFMMHANQQNLYVTHSNSENTHVGQTLMPISDLNVLVKLEEDYRKRIKPFSLKGVDKFVDQVDGRIRNLIKVVETQLDQVNQTTKGGEIDIDKVAAQIAAMDPGKAGNMLIPLVSQFQDHPESARIKEFIEIDLGTVIEDHNAAEVKRALSGLGGASPEALAAVLTTLLPGTGSAVGASDPVVAAKTKELSKFLLNFLTRLQTILRDLMTSFYSVYAQVKFEMVKYIYESARQFSY